MRKTLFASLFLFLSLAGLISCKSTASSSDNNRVQGDSILVGLERGPCFGQCPQFKATIYTTGFAEYYGERNTPMTGYYQAKIPKEKVQEFEGLLKRYNMAEADSAYVNKLLADYPAYWLTVSDTKGSRRILVNHEEPPVFIMDFTAELERMISQIPWKQAKKSDDQ